jgi:hypothetical protein
VIDLALEIVARTSRRKLLGRLVLLACMGTCLLVWPLWEDDGNQDAETGV